MYCMECRKYVGLTLTWDVLKLLSPCPSLVVTWINFNMGCIETEILDANGVQWKAINFNMGCIETIR